MGHSPLLLALLLAWPAQGQPQDPPGAQTDDRHPGLAHLYERAYQSFSLTPGVFDRLWTVWPEELKTQAADLDADERRRMALERYGLPLDPGRESGVPAAFSDPGDGRWVLNCLACHQGTVAGEFVPGVGNSRFAFRTLVDDYLWLRRAEDKVSPLLESQFGFIGLGGSNGTTNAQVFSALLAGLREPNLDQRPIQKFTHVISHDLDAPPLWHLAKKQRLYSDGYVEKDSRVIMQFTLAIDNTGEQIRGWEQDFADVLAWMESVEPPAYPHPVDAELAAEGQAIFEETCADCHGTYGETHTFPERRIPIGDLGTDPLRLKGLSREFRTWLRDSWLGRGGELDVVLEPKGYMAPPLDGLWASSPYLHNGSVPTLHHMLFPEQRPVRWRPLAGSYDPERIGPLIETQASSEGRLRKDIALQWFDTRRAGKSAAGHNYPSVLSTLERRALLEYLKTL